MAQKKRRIGVYVCHCGGNISDYVKVDEVAEAVKSDPNVAVAKTHVFTCSDAAQQEMIDEIQAEKLDGLVIASCSPKLHMFTFRGMSERANLNQYQYIHVNLREQCSWVHTNDKIGATEKGIHLLRAGIAKCELTVPLNAIRIETKPRVLVVGAGVSGMRAAISLADMGLAVFLIEREDQAGGWALQTGKMGPEAQDGTDVVAKLLARINQHENIMLHTGAEMVSKSGSIGDFNVSVRLPGDETVSLNVGAIVVTTGFEPYTPQTDEYGWGAPSVIPLKDFRQMLAEADGHWYTTESPYAMWLSSTALVVVKPKVKVAQNLTAIAHATVAWQPPTRQPSSTIWNKRQDNLLTNITSIATCVPTVHWNRSMRKPVRVVQSSCAGIPPSRRKLQPKADNLQSKQKITCLAAKSWKSVPTSWYLPPECAPAKMTRLTTS